MRFTIHDVGHGSCAHLKHDNGNVMLWDCGVQPTLMVYTMAYTDG